MTLINQTTQCNMATSKTQPTKLLNSVKQTYHTSTILNQRLIVAAKKTGLKETDISRMALSEWLMKNNF